MMKKTPSTSQSMAREGLLCIPKSVYGIKNMKKTCKRCGLSKAFQNILRSKDFLKLFYFMFYETDELLTYFTRV